MIKINATVILTVLNFLLFVAVLKTILWGPMIKFLEERAGKIKDSLRIADENKQRSEEIKVEHDEIIKEARRKAGEIVDKALASSSNESRGIIAEAREQAQATIDAARDEIKMEAERIKQELREDVAAMTVGLAGKVLEREISGEDHRELIKKSLDAMTP